MGGLPLFPAPLGLPPPAVPGLFGKESLVHGDLDSFDNEN